jgi:PAS domain S-box-containing protein
VTSKKKNKRTPHELSDHVVNRDDLLFRTIFENAPIMIDSFDAAGRCVLWNRECERVLGWTIEELGQVGNPLALFYPDPESQKRVADRINQADGTFREYQVRAKDGTLRFQSWADFRLPDGTVISMGYDLTALHRTDTALIESEEKYRAIFQEALDGIVLADYDGRIIDCNPEFEKQAGRTLEELKTMHVWELRPPDKVNLAREMFGQLLAKGFVKDTEQYFIRPDGHTVVVELHARRVDFGEQTYYQGITRDVTERKLTEEALRESEAKYRLLIENAGMPIGSYDRDGRVLMMNQTGAKNVKMTPGQVAGKTLYELFPKAAADAYVARFREVINSGIGRSFEDLVEIPMGPRWYWTIIEPLPNAHGEITAVQVVSHDVTERKRAEEEIRNSQEKLRALASRLQSIREEEGASIAREIHDELGQRLTGLKFDLRWIERRMVRSEPDAESRRLLQRLSDMSTEVDGIIQAVRRISTTLRPVILDDLGLLKALEWQSHEFERRTGIRCDFVSAQDEYVLDEARSTAVFRIFQEILTNVARHAQANHVDIHIERKSNVLALEVRDNGKGISESEIRGSQALGILGMQERAQACGGEVKIARNGGHGTRVTVRIPLENDVEELEA